MRSTNSYRIRNFEPGNQAEIERINLMYYHPTVMAAKGYPSADPDYGKNIDLLETDADIFNDHSVVRRQLSDISYAIADKANHLVGWIWFYTDKRHPLPVKVAKAYGLTPHNSRIYQISYEKLMSEGWPVDLLNKLVSVKKEHLIIPRKGVVVEGLALATKKLQRGYRKLYAKKRPLALYGYVQPNNIASSKVLEINGFTKMERLYSYDGQPHQLWVRVI